MKKELPIRERLINLNSKIAYLIKNYSDEDLDIIKDLYNCIYHYHNLGGTPDSYTERIYMLSKIEENIDYMIQEVKKNTKINKNKKYVIYKENLNTDKINRKNYINFGKYKNQPIDYIVENNPSYIVWCMRNIYNFEENLNNIQKLKIEHYLKKHPQISHLNYSEEEDYFTPQF